MLYLKIGHNKNIISEVRLSSLFYDSLTFEITADNSDEKTIYSLLPNRVSFKKNRQLIDDKISMLRERYTDQIKITNPPDSFSLITPFLYITLFLKIFFVKLFIPSQWVLAFREKGTTKWSKIKFENNELMADPFIYYYNSKYYILYEALNYDTNKGYIAIGTLDRKNKKIIDKKTIIEENYHLSYPFILTIDNDLYMVPESSYNNTVDLYKCTNFPYEWKKEKTLINDISAVDSNLFQKNGLWYLLTSIKNKGISFGDELTLYVTDDLFHGYFIAVNNNPVVHDISKSRNGGAIIDNIRISQDCSKRYGYKINFMEIIKLSQHEYCERYVRNLDLPFGTIAMHTYNKSNNIEIIDLKIINISPYFLYRNIIRISKKFMAKVFA